MYCDLPQKLLPAINWAKQFIEISSYEIVQRRPWGDTVMVISTNNKKLFLKANFHPRMRETDLFELVSALAPKYVPKLFKIDTNQGFLLLKDHGGNNFDSNSRSLVGVQGALETYARIQFKASRDEKFLKSFPRVFDAPSILQQLRSFLGLGPVKGELFKAAQYFLPKAELQKHQKVFSEKHVTLSALLIQAAKLPLTINHCDLHFGNIAITTGKKFIIYDWADSILGPAGLSISCFFGRIDPLFSPIHFDHKSFGRQLYSAYAAKLAKLGYCSEELLTHSLPAAALAGLLYQVLNFGLFAKVDRISQKFIKGQVSMALDDVATILARF